MEMVEVVDHFERWTRSHLSTATNSQVSAITQKIDLVEMILMRDGWERTVTIDTAPFLLISVRSGSFLKLEGNEEISMDMRIVLANKAIHRLVLKECLDNLHLGTVN